MSVAEPRRSSRRKLYPLTAPGMPFPGPDFIEHANNEGEPVNIKGKGKDASLECAGEVIEELHYKALYAAGRFSLPIRLKADRRKTMRFIPGHLWGFDLEGPVPAEVMVLGKMPGKEEESRRRNLIGPSSQLFLDALRYLNVKGMRHWYVTNLLKFRHPEDGSTLKSPWIKDCLPLLHQELRLVRPKFILCLGADASKQLLGDKYSVSYMEGRVIPYQYPLHRDAADEPQFGEALVMTCVHPAQVYRQPEMSSQMEFQLARFGQLINGIRFDQAEADIDHRVIRSEAELRALFNEIRRTCRDRWIALDAEWHGEHPQNKNAYLRTVQLSWAHKKAACIVLRAQGGADSFQPSPQRAAKLLHEFLNEAGDWRICGQFLNADLEWLIYEGIDPRRNFEAPDDWRRTRDEGGHDTGLAAHAIEETGNFGLESLSLRHTTAPRYDVALHEWREKFCKEHKLKSKDLEGYGECPEEILLPYGNYDADVTRRIAIVQQQLLDRDPFDNNCREAFWMSMRAAPAVLEVHRTGIALDRHKVDELTLTYLRARGRMERRIRKWAKWPEFNLNSVQQVREFLFGEQLNGKLDKEGKVVRIRPKGAVSLKLDPLLDTSKRPVSWKEIRERGEEGDHSPGTGKMILAIMAQESQAVPAIRKGKRVLVDYSQQINWIRDYRFISQVLKSTLRVPLLNEGGDDWDFDDSGFMKYPDGLPAAMCDDGRVRTHIYQTKETGRWSSARPPLQNLSKRREKDYRRILGPEYKYPLRSVICAGPGKVLVEADYIGAELFGMAVMSGDRQLIEHALRNQLPEDHPDFHDIHSNICVLAFRFDCPPTKKGLESIGKKEMRDVAKTVIFGIAYGRGAKAIALAVKEEGVYITVEEAQAVIDAVFQMYPGLVPFFESCRARVQDPRWMCGSFGRFRRFSPTDDFMVIGEQERQAMNFPIQGMIADAVSRACDHLYYDRPEFDVDYRIVMQIHDAILLECSPEHVPAVIDRVLPTCMSQRVPIYPCDLDGLPSGSGPHYLGIDTSICLNWGLKMTLEDCQRLGIDPKYAGLKAG